MRVKEKILLFLSIIFLLFSVIFLIFERTFFEKEFGFLSCLFLAVIFVFLNRYYIIECLTNSQTIFGRVLDSRYELLDNSIKVSNMKDDIKELKLIIKDYKSDISYLKNEISELKMVKNHYYKLSFKDLDYYSSLNIKFVDKLDGLEFEDYIKKLLIILQFEKVIKTKASNDYGVDILAEKDNLKFAIQCKNYSNILGNSCIQEVFSGQQYYNCDIAVVVTNNNFSKNAINLATKNGVLLWNRNKLIEMINQAKEIFVKNMINK